MATDQQPPIELQDPEWLEFEGLLSELARLAKSDISFERLSRSLLDLTVHILAAAGGAVWLGPRSGPLRLEYQVNHDAIHRPTGQDDHLRLLNQVRTEGESIVVPPNGVVIGTETLANPTDYTLLVAPLKMDREVVGLLEIAQRTSISAAAVRGNKRLLALVCELAADHLRRRELHQLRDEQSCSEHFDELTSRVHGTLDPRVVAVELANAGRSFIDCDRVAVVIRRGRRFRLAALSAVESIDRRSNTVRRLEDLASRVARTREAVWYDGENDDALAPQILETLKRFADESHPRMVGVLPLTDSRVGENAHRAQVSGVLIIEQFNSLLGHEAQTRAARIVRPSELALSNALRFQSLPTLPFARNRSSHVGLSVVRLFTMLLGLACIALMTWLLFVPMDFNVYAEGELQPEQLQQVFAPFDAQVATIAVQHGAQVEANDVLLELRSPDLDLETQRIQGEFATTQKRISAIQSSLLEMSANDNQDDKHASQLAAEEEELRELAASQQSQLQLLRDQRQRLVLRSPIAGQVVTWDLEQLLSDRPVQRGQSLMSVANLHGPWVAELRVPDDRIGHVLEARDHISELPGTFQLATNRGIDYHGKIRRISTRTEASDDDRNFVRVTMDLDETEIGDLRPGATIFARIHCGKRSAAYVLFHDLFDAVRNWVQF